MNQSPVLSLLSMSLLAVLLTTGCTADQSQTTSSLIIPTTEVTPVEAKKEETPVDLVPKTVGSFVYNENLKPVFFEISKSQLSPEASEVLKMNLEWLQKNPPYLMQIVGVSDMRGSPKRNHTLAERRAMKVREFYMAGGIPKDRMAIFVMGAEPTPCAEMSEICLQQHRRAETLIETKPFAQK